MRILLLGKNGLLGNALIKELQKGDFAYSAYGHTEIDITDTEKIAHIINEQKPTHIINATGYTQVDRAEEEREKAFEINGYAVGRLASLCSKLKIPVIHFSTDYVFNGASSEGYDENATPQPLNTYGASKKLGEDLLMQNTSSYYLVRTAWLYGETGKNFVDVMLSMAEKTEPLRVVNDQIGNPTYTFDLAQAVLRLLKEYPYGIYHIVNSGDISWYEFAVEIFKELGVPREIIQITTKELNRPALRPHYSMLRSTRFPPLRPWQEALTDYLKNKQLIL